MAPPSRRNDLVEAALRLFLRDGFHATGIAAVLAEAGVNKMTMYNHFASKDDLILAALELRDRRFRDWLFGRMAELAPDDPAARVLALFDALGEWFRGEARIDTDFRGCAFVKAAGEFAAADSPLHRAAAAHKQAVIAEITQLCKTARWTEPERLAQAIALLKEGAISEAFVRGDVQSWRLAKDMALTLISRQGL